MERILAIQKKKVLAWALLISAIVWLLSGPLPARFSGLRPAPWCDLSAALISLVVIASIGRPTIGIFLRHPKDFNSLPRYFTGLAVLITFFYSIAHLIIGTTTEDVATVPLHFHSATFLLFLDLFTRRFLTEEWEDSRPQSLGRWQLTNAMLARLEHADETPPRLLTKTRSFAPYLYMAVGVFSLVSLSLWFLSRNGDQGIIQMASILVVCSPWMFIFCLPNSFDQGILSAARAMVLLSSTATLEMANRLDAIVFGKRKTLTTGAPRVTDIIPMTGIDEEELLLWAASAEHGSRHPFGQAVVAEAKAQSIPLEPPERFTEVTGRGVECVIDQQPVRLGKPHFFNEKSVPAYLSDRILALAKEGKTPFICMRGDQYLGIIAVTEEIRSEAAAVIEKIRSFGLQTILLTGDDLRMSESIAERLHIDRVIAEVVPEEKPRYINKIRREGLRIASVGNYLEDGPSFSESELAITLSRGKGLELPPTDVILLEDKLEHIASFFEISNRTMRIARENRFFSVIYHVAAIVLVAGVLVPFGFKPINPVVAALMSGGGLVATILNNRRIRTLG